jgi:hypothetical protein
MATRGDTNATLKDLTVIAEDTVAQTRPSLVPMLCHMDASGGAYTKVPVPANMAMPRKFEAERASQGKRIPITQTYNQDTYELTIDLDSDLLKDAKAYDFGSLVREAAMSAAQFPDYLLSAAVAAGTANNAYDGNPFYGATHKFAADGTTNINNLVTQTAVTVLGIFNDLGSSITATRGFKDNARGGS